MFKPIARMLGRVALFVASAALIVAASLFLLGSYLVTWPVLRLSPRQRHLQAGMNLAAAVMTMASVVVTNADEDEKPDE